MIIYFRDDSTSDENSNSSNSNKGKKPEIIEVHDNSSSDDDSLDGMGSDDREDDSNKDNKLAQMAAIAKSPQFKNKSVSSTNASDALVAGPFEYKDVGFLWVVVLYYTIKPWYFKVEFLKFWCEALWNNEHPEKKESYPAWVLHLTNHPVREICDRANTIKKKKSNGYPIEYVSTTVLTKTNSKKEFLKKMSVFDRFRKSVFTANGETASVGEWFEQFIKRANLPSFEATIIKYTANDRTARTKQMTSDFANFGNLVHNYKFGYTLDHFWPDYSIKEFIKQWWHVYKFKDVDDDVLKQCYKDYPDSRNLPVWDDIVDQFSRGD